MDGGSVQVMDWFTCGGGASSRTTSTWWWSWWNGWWWWWWSRWYQATLIHTHYNAKGGVGARYTICWWYYLVVGASGYYAGGGGGGKERSNVTHTLTIWKQLVVQVVWWCSCHGGHGSGETSL